MKLIAAGMLVVVQMAVGAASSPNAEPKHLRYQRAVNVPAGAPEAACALLDASVFAHAESRAGDDMRVFSQDGRETPFALTENEPQPDAPASATVRNLGTKDGAVVFDLAMPSRAYSEVDLDLNAKDFVATAEVSDAASGTKLGTFTLFDLTAQHLSRATALPLQESTFSTLHVVLRFADAQGKAMPVEPAVVTGASVPPSRDAQALYTAVARSTDIRQEGKRTVVRFHVPAHVPVERLRVELDPAFGSNFVRAVSVREGSEPEEVSGEISRTKVKLASMPLAPAIHAEHLTVDAVMAANLREDATITVAIENGDDRPLPIRAVVLEMRQRRVCFQPTAGESYVLRYGDAALHAPVYDYARWFKGEAGATVASLGPETVNAQYVPRADVRSYTERHPELIWIALIGIVAVLGATAVSSVKHQGRG